MWIVYTVYLLRGLFCGFEQLAIPMNVVNCLPQCHKQVSFGDDFYHPFVVSHGEWPSIIYPCMCWSNPVKTPCLLVKPHQHLNKKSMFFPLRIQQVAASQETFRCGSTHQQEMFLSIWYYMRYVYPNVQKYSNIYVNIHV